ncbi:MAG TPA: Calx-beta domain-containing protein, partial [Pyrinomonadaceae bacterium]
QVVLTVVRTGGTSGAVSATVSTSGGTADAGADYTPVSQVVTFADGTSGGKTLTIPIADDALVEGNEAVNLTLGNPAIGTVLGSPASAVLTILDNDTCSYSITPSNHAALPAGERFTVNVTAQSGCAWTAVSNSSFINVTSGTSGTGNGTVTLVVLSNGTGAPRAGTATIAGQTLTVTQSEPIPDVLTLGFTQTGYEFDEGVGRATLTITRKGEVSEAASADYRTSDTDAFTIGCADNSNNGNGAFGRCDFATTVGRIDFAPGERQKTLTVPLIDDGHDENSETFQVVLSNLMGASSASPNLTATVTVHDNDVANAPNPIFTTPFFVRQHYLDFLSREPEAGEPWSGVLDRCPNVNNDASCDRLLVSQSFFGSPEFQLKGLYVFRFYKLAFNRLPEYTEIVSDMSFVAGATEAEVYARKAQLSRLFTERSEFQNAYGNLSNDAFVSALLGRYQLTQISTPDPAQPDGTAKVAFTRETLINRLNAGTLTRAQVFRAVADSDEASVREFDNAFVAMQ